MAKFYQPQDTQGMYESAPNRLTVNQDDDVRIGFRALTQKEYDEITVDTSENVSNSRVQAGQLAYELEIDTSKPITFQVTATKDVIMSMPQDVIRPLEVVVRGRGDSGVPCVGQGRDPMGCWAACFSYWLTVAGNGRPQSSFNAVLLDFTGMWNNDGSLNIQKMLNQLAAKKAKYRMSAKMIAPNDLDHYVGRWPMAIGFFRSTGGTAGHMNVLTAYDSDNDLARVMEPWFPEVPDNYLDDAGGQMVLSSDAGDFSFSGIITYRELGYYKHGMPGSGKVFVGYPSEYDHRMP